MSLRNFSWRKLLFNYKIVEFTEGGQGIRRGYLCHDFVDFYFQKIVWTTLNDSTNRTEDRIKVQVRYQLLCHPPKKVPPYKVVK